MKTQNINECVVLMAARYQPFEMDNTLLASLPQITAPSHYKDQVKIREYIQEAEEKRESELSTLWPLKVLDQVRMISFVDERSYPVTDTCRNLLKAGQYLKEHLAIVRKDSTPIQFLGIGIRDILRKLVVAWGEHDCAPISYQMIADQRDIIDPLSLLDTGDVKKWLDPVSVLRHIGIDIPGNYTPHQSLETDCDLAVQFYNRMCRNGSRPKLSLEMVCDATVKANL